MKSRIIYIYVFFVFISLIFIVRGAQIVFFPDKRLTAVKKRNFEKVIKLKPRRGIIYDRKGRELAISVASQSLFADPFLIKNPRAAAKKISRLLKISYNPLYKKIKNKKKRFVWIKRHLTDKEWKTIKKWKIFGLAFVEEPKRVYPNGQLLAQVLGFVGRSGHGLEGLELKWDSVLSGSEKKVLVHKDAMGRPLFSDIHISESLVHLRANGADIHLTIDSDLQFFFEKELKKTVSKFSAKSAMGIIMDPQTGEILSMAHFPSFDLNKPFQSNPKLFRNRTVTDAFEPGSTLKSFVVASALKKGVVLTKNYEGSESGFSVEGHTIREAEAGKYFQDLSLREILSLSSNVGSAQTALDVGAEFLYSVLKDFGFGSKLGIRFPGESRGILQKPPWKKLKLATIGFGHSMSATALQITSAYSAVAGGGLLRKPYLVKSIDYKETNRREDFSPQVLRKALNPKQAETMTVMLISAVSGDGTGRRAKVKGFLSAGKTGTAQVVDLEQGGYKSDKYISSFVGFIPAHNPRYVIYTAIEEPEDEFYGSRVAAPVFSRVAEYAVRQAGLSPTLIAEKNILQKQEVKLQNSEPAVERQPASEGKTPHFVGLSLRQAFQKARQNKIHLAIKGSGKVIKSVPRAGEKMPSHKKIHLTLSNEKAH